MYAGEILACSIFPFHCTRNTFCSLSAGLHPRDLWETQCAPRRLGKWTFKSKEKGGELINREPSIYLPFFSPGRIPRHNNEICLVQAKLVLLKDIWQRYLDRHRMNVIYICVCSPLGQPCGKIKINSTRLLVLCCSYQFCLWHKFL